MVGTMIRALRARMVLIVADEAGMSTSNTRLQSFTTHAAHRRDCVAPVRLMLLLCAAADRSSDYASARDLAA
jgi:hypothetical protein